MESADEATDFLPQTRPLERGSPLQRKKSRAETLMERLASDANFKSFISTENGKEFVTTFLEMNQRLADIELRLQRQDEAKDSKQTSSCADAVRGSNATRLPEMNQIRIVQRAQQDAKEKDEIKLNVVIRGLPEDLNANDEQKVSEIWKTLEIPGSPEISCERLGKQTDPKTNRPMRVKLKSLTEKLSMLRLARNLRKHPSFSAVFIGPELTAAERQHQFLLRQERNRLNSDLDESDKNRYVIFRGDLIRKNDIMRE